MYNITRAEALLKVVKKGGEEGAGRGGGGKGRG